MATLTLVASAAAVAGIIDIDQAKVLADGGFPYKINKSGSYRLTSDLTVLSTTANAIDVNADDVTIDLNGFSIIGPGPVSGRGINAGNLETIENGAITGFGGDYGIRTNSNSIVRNVRANSNFSGIVVNNNSVVKNCVANSNTSTAIACEGSGCAVSGNTVNSNRSAAVYCVGSGCMISGNVMNGNKYGIAASDGTTGYSWNVLSSNATNVSGGTSMGAGITNLCDGRAC
ncbi:MAG TPA: hypothetical protein VMT58_08990 [Candidatus Binataceae bacterium]|nr:hypothetical protein [Candidatus Binataceae bacterium]